MVCVRTRAGSPSRARRAPFTTPTRCRRLTRSSRRTSASCSSEHRKPNPTSPAPCGRTNTRTDSEIAPNANVRTFRPTPIIPPHLLRPGTGRPSAVSPHVGEDDGDKLLPGEASSAHSGDVDDARRWLETYDELCRLKHKILTDLESQKVRVPPEGEAEVKDDESMLRAEYERLLGRRLFWHTEVEARQGR